MIKVEFDMKGSNGSYAGRANLGRKRVIRLKIVIVHDEIRLHCYEEALR